MGSKKRANLRQLPPLMFLLGFLLIPLEICQVAQAAIPYAFYGGRAFQYLEHVVAFGPKPVGSKALEATRAYIIRQLKQDGCKVVQDPLTGYTPDGKIPMVNLIAELPGTEPRHIVMIAGHYDTKLEKNFRFVGANDGGSSTAFLLELARELEPTRHKLTYWIVFFDGEEALKHWSAADSLYGSRQFAQKLTEEGDLSRIRAMILVDMIGDAHLGIRQDLNSTPWLTQLVWKEADKLGYSGYFLNSDPIPVLDDHIPFVNRGVSAVDLIDFDYGPENSYWHTAQDSTRHCSPSSLTIVGRVVNATLAALENSPNVQ